MFICFVFYFSLFIENRRQGCHNSPAAFYLFLGLCDDAVHKFKVQFAHPCRATLWRVGEAAIEIEGCANGYLHAVREVWLQALHELFLLWCAKCYLNDVGAILFYNAGYAGVIELFDGAEGEFLECHALYIGVLFGEILLQGVEYILLCAKEYHAVLAGAYNVDEDVAATVDVLLRVSHVDVHV